MLLAIQQAYYLQAKKPSELNVLIKIAGQLGLDEKYFSRDIKSAICKKILLDDIKLCRNINISSFPSLVLKHGKSYTLLHIDYTNSKIILNQITQTLNVVFK